MSDDASVHRDAERLQRWYVRLAEEIETADLCQRTIGLSPATASALTREVMALTRTVDFIKKENRDVVTANELHEVGV
jgi:hypothetical protein